MKKKITILAAVLMGTASIVATTAHATALSVTVAGATNTTTATAPQAVSVPVSNVIDGSDSVALSATVDTGTSVSFIATGVRLVTALNSTSAPVTASSGTTSYATTSQGTAINVYAFTTSSEVGSVKIINGSYSTVVYIQGTAGPAATVGVSVPTNASVGTAPIVSVSAKDVFGNPVESEAISVTLVGALFADGSTVKTLTTATKVAALADTTGLTVAGKASATLSAVKSGSVTVVASDASIGATATGLPSAVRSVSAIFAVSDLDAQIAQLNAQVTSLTTQLKTATDALAAEKASHASDTATATAALNAEKTAHATDVANSKSAYNALVAKYNKLVDAYLAKALKYKFGANLSKVLAQ